MQGNLANTYAHIGRNEDSLRIHREVYTGYVRIYGREHIETLREALCYAMALVDSRRFEEVKALLRKTLPVARRLLGDGNETTLKMRKNYAQALCEDTGATLDDLREAVNTLEETERTAKRVLGGAHPTTTGIEDALHDARAYLRVRERPVERTFARGWLDGPSY